MNLNPTEGAAVALAVTAPGWANALALINIVLSTVSLVAGLAFLAWRWRRAASVQKGGAT